jgi:hypothetical protein
MSAPLIEDEALRLKPAIERLHSDQQPQKGAVMVVAVAILVPIIIVTISQL